MSDADPCRGCEWEALWGSPCGLHGKPAPVAAPEPAEGWAVVHGMRQLVHDERDYLSSDGPPVLPPPVRR